MKLSVIIPTYNEGKYLAKCIESLLNQKQNDFEIVIVDDGSTDNTQQILQDFKKNSRVISVRQDHKGAGAARNTGAKLAKGEIYIFVDADMVFEKIFLRDLVAPIVVGKVIGTFSKNEMVANWNNVWARCWNWNLSLPDRKRLPNGYPDHQKVFRAILASKFNKVHGFTEGGYTDDWSLSEKLKLEAVSVEGARFSHYNPSSLSEVYSQARWSAKRQYKLGIVGSLIAILRVSLLFTILDGVIKSILHKELRFIVFKFFYNTGYTVGVINFMLFGKGQK